MQPEKDETTIVLVGSLNPAIFHPAWFALNGLAAKDDINNATIDVVHNELSRFVVRGIAVSVEPFRFAATCAYLHRERIKDMVRTCFGDLLKHTPVRAMGINRSIHFKCPSEKVRDRVGRKLAPLAPWGTWGKDIQNAPVRPGLHGGMIRLTMREEPRSDNYDGYIGAEVQPSTLLSDNSGIYLEVNNHFKLAEKDPVDAESAVEVLEDTWDSSLEKSTKIFGELMKFVDNEMVDRDAS